MNISWLFGFISNGAKWNRYFVCMNEKSLLNLTQLSLPLHHQQFNLLIVIMNGRRETKQKNRTRQSNESILHAQWINYVFYELCGCTGLLICVDPMICSHASTLIVSFNWKYVRLAHDIEEKHFRNDYTYYSLLWIKWNIWLDFYLLFHALWLSSSQMVCAALMINGIQSSSIRMCSLYQWISEYLPLLLLTLIWKQTNVWYNIIYIRVKSRSSTQWGLYLHFLFSRIQANLTKLIQFESEINVDRWPIRVTVMRYFTWKSIASLCSHHLLNQSTMCLISVWTATIISLPADHSNQSPNIITKSSTIFIFRNEEYN